MAGGWSSRVASGWSALTALCLGAKELEQGR